MDVGKWLADTAKEAVGLNDFEKAKDAFDRANKTSQNAGDGFFDKVKSLPSYTKDIAVGVGDAAVGAGKAVVNVGSLLIPEAKAAKAASLFKPKFPGIKPGITKPRQFTPKVNAPKPSAGKGGVGVLEKPKTEAAPKAETPAKTEPSVKNEPKASSKKASGRKGAFAAGAAAAALAGSGKDSGDKPWTPSAIV